MSGDGDSDVAAVGWYVLYGLRGDQRQQPVSPCMTCMVVMGSMGLGASNNRRQACVEYVQWGYRVFRR